MIDNSKVKLTRGILKNNVTLDYKTLDKKSSAPCKTKKGRLSNVTTRKIKDECKED